MYIYNVYFTSVNSIFYYCIFTAKTSYCNSIYSKVAVNLIHCTVISFARIVLKIQNKIQVKLLLSSLQ